MDGDDIVEESSGCVDDDETDNVVSIAVGGVDGDDAKGDNISSVEGGSAVVFIDEGDSFVTDDKDNKDEDGDDDDADDE